MPDRPAGGVTIRRLDGAAARAQAGRVWPVYDEIFADWDSGQRWREDMFERHSTREGYRLLLAESGEELVGFAWGYTGQPGQFWTDWVGQELPEVAREWSGDHDELVTIGVRPSYRGRGIAGQLLDAFLAESGERVLLGTENDATAAAVRLYRSRGFEQLGLLTPVVQVMGRRRS